MGDPVGQRWKHRFHTDWTLYSRSIIGVNAEDVEAALWFLFAAMAPKPGKADPFGGVSIALYLDNGPVTKSAVFRRVMDSLGAEVLLHMPAGSDSRHPTTRAKDKAEGPFRTVKDAHETLCHFHQPATTDEANRWQARFGRIAQRLAQRL